MSPIITHQDELELAKLAKWQRAVGSTQIKLAADLAKMNIARQTLNRIFRDVLKQMQTLAREHRSNVNDEEVNTFQNLITNKKLV